MQWKCSEFKHLSTHELYSILRASSTVFVVEYAHVHLDIDDKDQRALHICGLESDGRSPQVVAYARLVPGNEQEPEVVMDKLLTVSKRRDDDTRDLLMIHALAAAQTVWPGHPIHINVAASCNNNFHRSKDVLWRKILGKASRFCRETFYSSVRGKARPNKPKLG